MELSEEGFSEEQQAALKTETWNTSIPTEINEMMTNGWNFDMFSENPAIMFPNSSSEGFYTPFRQDFNSSFTQPTPFLVEQAIPFSAMEEEAINIADYQNLEMGGLCKVDQSGSPEIQDLKIMGPERKIRGKKMEGQLSKNLMAERRRRKKLNDRLSMLRSIVPKISKMDRTSTLADAIDYMKHLLERVNNIQKQNEIGSNDMDIMRIFKGTEKSNEITIRNAAKFDVEKRNMDTHIQVVCPGQPGLLVSTVNTVEALGLQIQHCVISAFNDFAMQASCSEPEELGHRALLSCENIKQELLRNAGYGGRCL